MHAFCGAQGGPLALVSGLQGPALKALPPLACPAKSVNARIFPNILVFTLSETLYNAGQVHKEVAQQPMVPLFRSIYLIPKPRRQEHHHRDKHLEDVWTLRSPLLPILHWSMLPSSRCKPFFCCFHHIRQPNVVIDNFRCRDINYI